VVPNQRQPTTHQYMAISNTSIATQTKQLDQDKNITNKLAESIHDVTVTDSTNTKNSKKNHEVMKCLACI